MSVACALGHVLPTVPELGFLRERYKAESRLRERFLESLDTLRRPRNPILAEFTDRGEYLYCPPELVEEQAQGSRKQKNVHLDDARSTHGPFPAYWWDDEDEDGGEGAGQWSGGRSCRRGPRQQRSLRKSGADIIMTMTTRRQTSWSTTNSSIGSSTGPFSRGPSTDEPSLGDSGGGVVRESSPSLHELERQKDDIEDQLQVLEQEISKQRRGPAQR